MKEGKKCPQVAGAALGQRIAKVITVAQPSTVIEVGSLRDLAKIVEARLKGGGVEVKVAAVAENERQGMIVASDATGDARLLFNRKGNEWKLYVVGPYRESDKRIFRPTPYSKQAIPSED